MTGTTSVLDQLDSVRGWQEELYRDLHQHPELPHQEHRTAATVAARLTDLGCEVHEGVGGTGVVAVLRNGVGPTVLLSADMDALPVQESPGLRLAPGAGLRAVRRLPADPERPRRHRAGGSGLLRTLQGRRG